MYVLASGQGVDFVAEECRIGQKLDVEQILCRPGIDGRVSSRVKNSFHRTGRHISSPTATYGAAANSWRVGLSGTTSGDGSRPQSVFNIRGGHHIPGHTAPAHATFRKAVAQEYQLDTLTAHADLRQPAPLLQHGPVYRLMTYDWQTRKYFSTPSHPSSSPT